MKPIVRIKDKAIADIIEAIIGAFLLAKGHDAAIEIIMWFGLKEKANSNIDLPEKENTSLDIKNLTDFQEKIGYHFNKKKILNVSLTPVGHQDIQSISYNNLIFSGEAVLQYLVSRCIFDRYREAGPGVMTDLRTKVYNQHIYSCLSLKYRFDQYLILKDRHHEISY